MNSAEIVCSIVKVLDRNQVPHMVVGSIAANLYRIPRSTEDADLVIESPQAVAELLLRELDVPFKLDPQLRFENVTGNAYFRIDLPDSHFAVEFFQLRQAPYDLERFRRRVKIDLGDCSVWALTAEDVVLSKLRWIALVQRLKDIDDVMHVIVARNDRLDWNYVKTWAKELGVEAELAAMIARQDTFLG